MQVRVCTDEDVIGVLELIKTDKDLMAGIFSNFAHYQKWILDAIYGKQFQVLVVNNGTDVVGILVWQLYQTYFKWTAYLHFIYAAEDHRDREISDELVMTFVKNVYNSSAQRLKFNSLVLPDRWVDLISANAPLDKYNTYYIERTDETKEWYNNYVSE